MYILAIWNDIREFNCQTEEDKRCTFKYLYLNSLLSPVPVLLCKDKDMFENKERINDKNLGLRI